MKRILISFLLLAFSLFVFANHLGTAIPFKLVEKDKVGKPAIYIEKTDHSHRQIILEGTDYHRGNEFGLMTRTTLQREEDLMTSKLDGFIGNAFMQKLVFTGMMLWFHDVDKYIDEASLKEMQGVGEHAPRKYESLASNYTRQIALHGLHEVGQMFVDEDRVDMGCFVTSIKGEDNHWVIGRNFDFDIDGLFDEEKILKWVFPEEGHAYLSVVWPGMVGVVSGVNDQGIYASVNAAGSEDFARVGTPTTIIVKNVLAKTKNLQEAIEMIKGSKVFITEIFVVASQRENQVAYIEKSAKKIAVKILSTPDVVANHLRDPMWANDEINRKRTVDLTSESRQKRGEELIKEANLKDPVMATALMLRDRKLPDHKRGFLGNRGTIDSFIASQSLIYDLKDNMFYVNHGPGTIGKYIGYNLTESFKQHYPVTGRTLDEDKTISLDFYVRYQRSIMDLSAAEKKTCDEKKLLIEKMNIDHFVHSDKSRFIGDYNDQCLHDKASAKKFWQESLDLNPPYRKQRDYLQGKLK